MNHSFNVEVAKKHGVEMAILIENIAFWIKKNKANNNNFYDGHYWTYNSAKAFAELFPYWSHFKLQRLLVQLEEKQLIKSGNYNKVNYDRTKWYAIIEESIMQIYTIDNAELQNGKCDTAEPIPDINTNIKPDKYIPPIPAELLSDYLKLRKAKKTGEFTETAFKQLEKQANKAGITTIQAIEMCCMRGWVGFRSEWLDMKADREQGRQNAAKSIFKPEHLEHLQGNNLKLVESI